MSALASSLDSLLDDYRTKVLQFELDSESFSAMSMLHLFQQESDLLHFLVEMIQQNDRKKVMRILIVIFF